MITYELANVVICDDIILIYIIIPVDILSGIIYLGHLFTLKPYYFDDAKVLYLFQ